MAKKKIKDIASQIIKHQSEFAGDYSTLTYGDGEDKVEVRVKNKISLKEHIAIVRGVVETVFVEDLDGDIVYAPELKEFAIGEQIISHLTDMQIPEDAEVLHQMIECTTIIHDIMSVSNDSELCDIFDAIDESIAFRKEQIIKQNSSYKLIDSISKLVQSIQQDTENMDTQGILDVLRENSPELESDISQMIKESKPADSEDSTT